MKVKDHFVKMAFDMIGEEKAEEIVINICKAKRISRPLAREFFNELKRCKYILTDEPKIDKIKEINYE
jgi:hypothetical protein